MPPPPLPAAAPHPPAAELPGRHPRTAAQLERSGSGDGAEKGLGLRGEHAGNPTALRQPYPAKPAAQSPALASWGARSPSRPSSPRGAPEVPLTLGRHTCTPTPGGGTSPLAPGLFTLPFAPNCGFFLSPTRWSCWPCCRGSEAGNVRRNVCRKSAGFVRFNRSAKCSPSFRPGAKTCRKVRSWRSPVSAPHFKPLLITPQLETETSGGGLTRGGSSKCCKGTYPSMQIAPLPSRCSQ